MTINQSGNAIVDIVRLEGTERVRVHHLWKRASSKHNSVLYHDWRPLLGTVDCKIISEFLNVDAHISIVFEKRLIYVKKIGSGNHGKKVKIVRSNRRQEYFSLDEGVVRNWWNGPTPADGSAGPNLNEWVTALFGVTAKEIPVVCFEWPSWMWPFDIQNVHQARAAIAAGQQFLMDEGEDD